MRFWKRWLPFLLVNIFISAATTIIVLILWSRANPSQRLTIQFEPGTESPPVTNIPLATLPPLSEPVIAITNVFGAGNLENEYVVVKRVGQGDLNLSGWYLMDEQGDKFVFPEFDLMQGELEIYTRSGVDSANKLYWNANKAMWGSGEIARILDPQGQERSAFTIP
ncbi:MAG: hypothetical protein BGO78_07115 [Chloroflexi bacterium 44-23]|nr:MAG: hypothetical protein BGO78_07115 [Chloroflexi bacterium 44-23]